MKPWNTGTINFVISSTASELNGAREQPRTINNRNWSGEQTESYAQIGRPTCVIGSFMMRTSVTVPNMLKYSRSFSLLVCQERPPTKSLPGAGSPPFGVLLPELPEWLPFIGTNVLWKSCSIAPFVASMPALRTIKDKSIVRPFAVK